MLYIFILLLLLIMPETVISSTKESILLWCNSVLPNLLPFFIISKALYYNDGAKYFEKLFAPFLKYLGISKCGCFPFVISLLCGFPTGSRIINEMNNDGLNDIDYYGNICFSASPLFIIGTVGTLILNNTREGYSLYVIHICTVLIFTSFQSAKSNRECISTTVNGTLSKAITESISSILSVCCYMVLYNIITSMIVNILKPPANAEAIISGLFEFTSGISKISQSFSYEIALPLISFFLSFGGACVITQCLSFLKGVNIIKFILNRFLCGMIAFILCLIYKKTAIYVPIMIALITIIIRYIFRRKKIYLLKSARSCAT